MRSAMTTKKKTIISLCLTAILGSKGHFWFLQVSLKYEGENDSKTTLLLGLLALMEILPSTINGFELHLLDETSSHPALTNNWVEDGFPSSAILAFKYCGVKNKQFSWGLSQQLAPSKPSPHWHIDEEEFKPSPYLWAIIPLRGNANIKDACEEISWDIQEICWKEHQSAELNAQIMIMCVPNIFDRVGLEEEVIWHLKDIKKSLIKKGTISSELIGIPLPEIKIL
jgi:hypothetical protein